jgi:CRP-like cAMP-binding protein
MAHAQPSTDLIRGVPFLSALNDAAAERLASEFVERRYAPGELILAQGQDGKSFFLVDQGDVSVTIDGDVAGTIGGGGFFGELALAQRESRRAATIRAESEVLAWSLPIWVFRPLVESNPEVAWGLIEYLADRVRQNHTV